MAAVPGFTAHTKGREVLLAFDEVIGPLISDAFYEDNDADAIQGMEHFLKTAKEHQYHRLC